MRYQTSEIYSSLSILRPGLRKHRLQSPHHFKRCHLGFAAEQRKGAAEGPAGPCPHGAPSDWDPPATRTPDLRGWDSPGKQVSSAAGHQGEQGEAQQQFSKPSNSPEAAQ